MNKEIRLIYLDFKLIIMEIEDSKEIYKAALLYITSNNRKYDKTQIIVSLKSISETFSNIFDYEKPIIKLLKDNELIPSYYLLISLIINSIVDKIWILLDILENNKIPDNNTLTKIENIFNLTDHLQKNIEYIFICIEQEHYKNGKK